MLFILIVHILSHISDICPFNDSITSISEKELRLTPNTINKYHFCEINSQFDVSFGNDDDSSKQVTKIPDCLFRRCHINIIIFSKYITTIGYGSFYDCTINEIKFEEDSQMTSISSYAFFSTSFVRPFMFPKTIEFIGDSAFQYSGIQNINFSQIIIIGKNTFLGCDNLIGPLNFPPTLEYIGQFSFYKCKKLSQPIIFNFKKLVIGKSAFEDCFGLKNSVLTFNNVDKNNDKNDEIDLNIDFEAFKNIKFSKIVYQGRNQIKYEQYISNYI